MNDHPKITELDNQIQKLAKNNSFTNAEKVIEKVVALLDINCKDSWNYLDLKKVNENARWFVQSEQLTDKRLARSNEAGVDKNIDIKAYQVRKISKQRIAWIVALTPNFEDEDFDLGDNIGLDFVISPQADKVIIVLSNRFVIRTLELQGKLNNTQKGILKQWTQSFDFNNKKQLHQILWDSFDVEPINKLFYKDISAFFYEQLEFMKENKNSQWNENQQAQFVNRLISRIVFCWFLDKKDLLDKDQQYLSIETNQKSMDYYQAKLEPLFFEILNTPKDQRKLLGDTRTPYLNGGLFEEKLEEYSKPRKFSFSDDYFYRFYEFLNHYNFTTDESTSSYQQIAIDPEMLGKIFENLLAEQSEETGEQARKAKGAFYTPREIVDYMCKESLKAHLKMILPRDKQDSILDKLIDMQDRQWVVQESNYRTDLKEYKYKIIESLDKLKVLDPACGSGAFPMGMMQLLLTTHNRLQASIDPAKKKIEIIGNNLYGVDIEPMATEISRLRAWLSIIVDLDDSPDKIKPLPNLDFKFVSANALLSLDKQLGIFDNADFYKTIGSIVEGYFSTNGVKEKEELREKFNKLYKNFRQGEFFASKQQNQLRTFHPFNAGEVATFFDPQLIFALKEKFDIIIGNPPYIQLQKNNGKLAELYKKQDFQSFARSGDIYSLFYERGNQLLKDKGHLAFITSNKWMRAGYGQKSRRYLTKETTPKLLIDLGPDIFESATVDTNILLFQKNKSSQPCIACSIKEKLSKTNQELTEYVKDNKVEIANFSDEAWVISNSQEQALKEKIERIGTALKDWDISINYGIKTGYNEAFIIDGDKKDELIAKDPKNAEIIKPILRGRDIKRYYAQFADKWLIATHNGYKDNNGNKIEAIDINNYPTIKEYLDLHWDKVFSRQDKGITPYNLRHCAYYQEFDKEKIIYPNMTKYRPFVFDIEKYCTNQKCFIITGSSLKYLVALLNSWLFDFCFKDKFPQLQGGTLELSKIFFNKLLVSQISTSEQTPFIDCVDKILALTSAESYDPKNPPIEQKQLEAQIDQLVYKLYQLTPDEIHLVENNR